MTADVLHLHVGARIWYEGCAWTVVQLESPSVVLQSAEKVLRVYSPALIGTASPLDGVEPPTTSSQSDADNVVLTSLPPERRTRILKEAEHYENLLFGPQETGEDPYTTLAAELGVSSRTARRRAARYAEEGLSGLTDARLRQPTRPSTGQEWDEACVEVLESYSSRSNPTMRTVIDRTNSLFLERHPEAHVPSQTSCYRRLHELNKGRYTFGSAKQRRSVSERPKGVMGRLRADRPGEVVVLDTTRLDVFAMEPVTKRWLNTELTVAMDLYSRCILGLALRPISTKSHDVASVLYQVVTPQTWGSTNLRERKNGPYAGVPDNIITLATGALPDTIVVDHGKVFLSTHTRTVCHRLGINIQPALPHKPTDKPTVERFFRTIRQTLLERLPAYKGPDVYSRGAKVEDEAFYHVDELEAIIRDWVGIYHNTPHSGLCDPHFPNVKLSPAEMFDRGLATSGVLRLPASDDLRMEFLDVAWRTIQHYGVEIDGKRYDGNALNLYRGMRSPYKGIHAGKWPIMIDHDDIRTVFFQDPETRKWSALTWEHAPALTAPLSSEAAHYTRKLSLTDNRHVDTSAALEDLLMRYSEEKILDRREKNVARRLAASSRHHEPDLTPNDVTGDGIIDLVAHLENRKTKNVQDDLDVFDKYYAEHPEDQDLQVFDE